jgi:tRNA-2-methylthio-N6-dimethylallyladenosine synthase
VDVEMSKVIDAAAFFADGRDSADMPYGQVNGQVSQFVTIMRGCDNFCTYCVVPHVRGRENSRTPEHIVDEIRKRVAAGAKEVTLLGQNVNSYGQKEGLCTFPELLARINDVQGLLRIRFTTSHPKDLSDDLIFAFRDLDKLCRHIHLPVQSGSDRILKKMNRRYTRQLYQGKVAKLRQVCPDIAISSDIIVGFPGETESDFEETLGLIESTTYDSLFAFMYSDRPNAPALRFSDKIAEQVKKERLQKVLSLQAQATITKNRFLVGKTEVVLVEGLSKKPQDDDATEGHQALQWSGRTSTNKIVNFGPCEEDLIPADALIGELIDVKIEKAHAHSLQGKPVASKPRMFRSKGEDRHAV